MDEQEFQPCAKHPAFLAKFRCRTCGAAICEQCIANLGEYCSSACLDASMQTPEFMSEETRKKGAELRNRQALVVKIGVIGGFAVLLLVLLLTAWFAWKHWLHPYARVSWRQPGGGANAATNRWLAATDEQAIVEMGNRFLAFAPADGRIIWEVKTRETDWERIERRDGTITALSPKAMARISEQGRLLWEANFPAARRVQSIGPGGIAFIEGEWLSYDDWKKFQAELGNIIRDVDLGGFGARVEMPPQWVPKALVLISAETGEDVYRLAIPPGGDIENPAVGEDFCAFVLTRTSRDERGRPERTLRLAAIDLQTQKPLFRPKPLENLPSWGPKVEDGQIVFCTFDHTIHLDRQGEVVQREVGLRPPETAPGPWSEDAEDDVEWGGLRVQLEDYPDLSLSGGGVTAIDPDTARQKWQVSLKGGVVEVAANDDMVFLNGHATEAGGQGGMMAEGMKLVGLDGGAGAALGAAIADPKDWLLIAVDRDSGAERWRQENVCGDLVCDDDSLVVLWDTAITSPQIRTNNLRGELTIRQFHPEKGKQLYSRHMGKELALRQPRILAGKLVAFEYDRKQIGKSEKRGNCRGLIAVRIR